MSNSVSRRTTCRLCEDTGIEVVFRLKPTPIADHYVAADRISEKQELYSLDLALCHNCGHFQLIDVVDPKILFVNYIYMSSYSPGLIEHFKQYAAHLIESLKPAPGTLAIDIGSNIGALLGFLKDLGKLRVLGIDPAKEIARHATESGVETLPNFFSSALATEIKATYGNATIITANNVFAHSDNLADMTDGVRTLLAPNGVFVFEVNYLVDIVQNFLFDTIYHEHLCYHSVAPLQKFMTRHGLELINAEPVPTKGGSIRFSAQLAGGPRKQSESIAKYLALEKELGVHRKEYFTAYQAKIDGLKTELHTLLRGLKASGKSIAGFGASATVTTLMYHFELGDLVEYLVDDNKDRHGLYSPGFHLPILSPQELYDRKPDYTIVLAWRFAKPIMTKHDAYLRNGGHFIVPIPKLEVI